MDVVDWRPVQDGDTGELVVHGQALRGLPFSACDEAAETIGIAFFDHSEAGLALHVLAW